MDPLPRFFVERMTQVLGSRAELDRLLDARPRSAIRVNTLKGTLPDLVRRLDALGIRTEPVPYAPESLFVEDPAERGLGNLWEHQSGRFFGQDAASTLPVAALDPRPGGSVLDICAAPGGKASHIAARMQNTGLLVANEVSRGRLNNLVSVLDRVGVANAVVTRMDAFRRRLPLRFDRVLVDAPCSNLGSMHADWAPVRAFTRDRVALLVGTQRGLLETAFHACRPDGVIVYSTCTLEPAENEGVVSWFLERFPVAIEAVPAPVKAPALASCGAARFHDDAPRALRIHAGDIGTDGFFVARFRKLADAPWDGSPRGPSQRHTRFGPAPTDALSRVADAYGLADGALDGMRAVQGERRLYATSVGESEALLALGAERVGLYLGAREPDGLRLGFDAATLLGRGASRCIRLDAAGARRWMAGEGVPSPPEARWSIVSCGDELLGCGRSFGATLPSFVPKERRVPAEGQFAGFIAAGDA